MMAGRPKSIVTQAMVTSVKKRLKGAKKGCTVSVSEGTWLHFGSVGITLHKVGITLHKVGELNLTRTKHVNRWQEKTIKQINEELHNSPWRP